LELSFQLNRNSKATLILRLGRAGRSAKKRGVFGASLRIHMCSIMRRRSGLMVCSVMEMRLPRVGLLNPHLQDRTPHPAPLVLQRSEAILDHERRYVGGVLAL